jgi:hypothetical protein
MAHPCCSCGSECYCNGDIDDVIVSKTPSNCETCGCYVFWEGEGDFDDDFYDDDDSDDEGFEEDETELRRMPDGGLRDPETGITHYP